MSHAMSLDPSLPPTLPRDHRMRGSGSSGRRRSRAVVNATSWGWLGEGSRVPSYRFVRGRKHGERGGKGKGDGDRGRGEGGQTGGPGGAREGAGRSGDREMDGGGYEPQRGLVLTAELTESKRQRADKKQEGDGRGKMVGGG